MTDESNWLEWAFKSAVAVIGLGLAGWSKWLMRLVRDNTTDILEMDSKIRDHELDDARNFVSKQDFKDTVMEMKDTTKRIYEKMDQILLTLRKP